MSDFSRWRALSADDRLLLLRTVRRHVWFALAIQFVSLESLVGARTAADSSRKQPCGGKVIERIVWANRTVSCKLGTSCLVRALAVRVALAREGVHAAVTIGVKRPSAGSFEAHAWIEVNGQRVDAADGSDGYAVLLRAGARA